jgi:hypothetical protein
MSSSGMLRREVLVRTGVSEELSASYIRVTKIGELGKTLAVTINRRRLRRYQDKEFVLQRTHKKFVCYMCVVGSVVV